MAAVAQEKGLGFGEAIGKELGIVDGHEIKRLLTSLFNRLLAIVNAGDGSLLPFQ